MILVQAILCPKGDTKNARVIGKITIANDGTGTEAVGHYTGELHAEYTPAQGPGRKAEVRGFNRKTQSVWTLVGAFLKCWRHTNIPKRQTEETTAPPLHVSLLRDLLENPYPADLMDIRLKVASEYNYDEEAAAAHMEAYCTADFLAQALKRHKCAEQQARNYLALFPVT